ncbi:MAG: AAA family ATPase, partial [Patescibacteria group bacterium]|nr:AAA family ATPase [Patescibacteria group bacterium]
KKNAIVNLLAGSQNAATQNLVKRLTATYLNIKQFIPEESRKAIEEDFDELKTSSHSSQESVIIKHLKFLLELPWGKHDPETKDLNKVKQFLDADHYGLRPIKEKISRYIALKMMNPKAKSGILCFAGPPGVGKTSITSSIASALGLQFVRMSLGGVSDEADIRGHRRTYVGADPGRILTAIKRAGTLNPVVVIDEIDKVGSGNIKGDISSALLEVLDPEQNFAFIDHYAGCPFDLSKVFFILTANDLKMIPEPLRDRAEIIILPGYTKEEKVNIATKFLIKKQEELVNPNKEFNLRINDEDIKKIIEDYTAEAGVRELERKISALYQRSAELFLTTNKKEFNASDIIKGFGPGYHSERARKTVPGSAIGLYWSMIGGGIVYFETVFVEGLSKSISRTGKMGESMIESTKDIMTLLRERYANADELKDLTAHISAITNAGIDGPSAGIAGLLSAYSALKKIPVKPYLAMTGKIDILGNVLPIGGVLEKLLGAEQAGIKEVIVPADNRENVEWELREYKLDLKIHYVKNTDQAMIIAFGRKFVKKEKKD